MQSVHDVTVLGNTFFQNDGSSVDFTGDLENISVEGSTICRSGAIRVAEGPGNSVEGNRNHC
jgi:hypothetical protein